MKFIAWSTSVRLFITFSAIMTLHSVPSYASFMGGEVNGFLRYTDGTVFAEVKTGDLNLRVPEPTIGAINEVMDSTSYYLSAVDSGTYWTDGVVEVDNGGLRSYAHLSSNSALTAPNTYAVEGQVDATSVYGFDFYSGSDQTVTFSFQVDGYYSYNTPSASAFTEIGGHYSVGLFTAEEGVDTYFNVLDSDSEENPVTLYSDMGTSLGSSTVNDLLTLSVDVNQGRNIVGFNFTSEVGIIGTYTEAFGIAGNFLNTLTVTNIMSQSGGISVDSDNLFVELFSSFDGVGVRDDQTAPVPEPTTMLLFGTGIAGLAGARIRSRKK